MGILMKKIEILKKEIINWEELKKEINDVLDFIPNVEDEKNEDFDLAKSQFEEVQKRFGDFEKQTLYSSEFDEKSAILSIHAGAGGVDAQDWSEMLLRMFLRYAEKSGYQAKILSETRGGEAGIKSAEVEISGLRAFGNLRSEAGVHRLVRLSPFNSDNLRQTSFALVEVIPVFDEDGDIEILPEEIRIDTFRSSGAGGQSVNTTDSAVRITHLPTKTVVACQNERSQLQNKEKAMMVLRSRLIQKKEEEKKEKEVAAKGEHKSAEWGNQIRSYVLHPYKMVKDHRTKHQTSETDKVLDGELFEFVESFLRNKNTEIKKNT